MMRPFIFKILVPLFVIVGFLVWLLDTTSGLKAVIWTIQKTYPGQLSVGAIEGSILKKVEIHDINYLLNPGNNPEKDNKTENSQKPMYYSFQAKKLILKGDFLELLHNTIHISELQLEDGMLLFFKYPASPIVIDKLLGDMIIETPYRSEIININEMSGRFQNESFQGTLHLMVHGKNVEELRAELKLGKNFLTILPATNFVQHLNNGQYSFTLSFQPTETCDLSANGILHLADLSDITGIIQKANIDGKFVDTWTLSTPVSFSVQKDSFKIDPLRFVNAKKSELLLQTAWDKSNGGSMQIDIPEFVIQAPQMKSKVSLHLTLHQPPLKPITGSGELKIAPGHANISLPNKKFYKTPYAGGSIKIDLKEKGLNLHLQFKESAQNTISATLKVPDFSFNKPFSSLAINGELTGKLQDLSIAYLLAPPISRLKAILDISGTFAGSLSNPILQLNANLHDGIFSIPKHHITIKSFSADLTGEIPGQLKLQSTGTLGGNSFYIDGFFEPFTSNGQNFFEITGSKLRVSNTSNFLIFASPKLRFNVIDNDLFVTGSINIPEANIIMKQELHHVIISKDVVFHGPSADNEVSEINLIPMVDITIEENENVHFKGFGLDAAVKGNIAIEKRPDGLYTGTGRLAIIDGKYRLQGSQYHVQQGHLLYPPGTLLNNPVLDIRIAKTRSDQVGEAQEVGIYVQGTLQDPTFNPYSTNDLQNTEILSRLGFGGNHIEGEDSQRQLLSQTAMYIVGGANPIIESVQSKLGLQEFGVQSAESQRVFTSFSGYDTVLVAGKSLSKRIYLQFIQGMLEPLSMVRLKYFLSPRLVFSVETSNAEDIGGDISFSMESN